MATSLTCHPLQLRMDLSNLDACPSDTWFLWVSPPKQHHYWFTCFCTAHTLTTLHVTSLTVWRIAFTACKQYGLKTVKHLANGSISALPVNSVDIPEICTTLANICSIVEIYNDICMFYGYISGYTTTAVVADKSVKCAFQSRDTDEDHLPSRLSVWDPPQQQVRSKAPAFAGLRRCRKFPQGPHCVGNGKKDAAPPTNSEWTRVSAPAVHGRGL